MPYPNEHTCRLRDPDDFQPDSFRRVERKHDGKKYSIIMGRLKGEETMTEQAYRYDKEIWTEAMARQHCQDHDGSFEPASDEHGLEISGVECCGDERGGIEFRFVGSPRNPYGTHASKGYPGGREAWKKAWRVYLSRVKDQGPIQGTVRRVSMIAAAMKPPCKLPQMSAEDLGPREGPCGPLEGKVYQKPGDYNLSQWKKPSDDDLEQEDIQLTCQDLEDIKRICLQEIAKRQECAEKEKKARAAAGWIGIGDVEMRAYPTEMRVIAAEGEPARIVGHAAVFNQLSDDFGGFREQIEPGAFAKTIREADIRALWNHDANYVLGRTKNDTLRLREDDHGLAFEILPPNTQWARDALITLGRGDVDQASFGFRTIRDRWEDMEDRSIVRTLVEVKLFDISPVTFPAYPQTSAQVRAKLHEFQRSIAVPGQGPHPAGADDDQARARLEIMRRRLDLYDRY